MEKINLTPWKGDKYELVDFKKALIAFDGDFLLLDMDFKWEFEDEDEMGIKKPARSSTNFKAKLRRSQLMVEVGKDHHHEDRLCERDLPVIIIRSVYNFSFWLYLEPEHALALFKKLNDWMYNED